LFLVPNGETESWWRQGPAEKPKWILAALNALAEHPKEFEEVQKFILEAHQALASQELSS
jgi:hypothetical protein